MGNFFFGVAQKLHKREEAPSENNASGQAPMYTGTEARMLILALDYPGTRNELTCTRDGANMRELAENAGVTDITVLENSDANYENVEGAIRDVLGRCQPGDFFIFNYSGHGTDVPDVDQDEKDGKDEALCLVTEDGKLDWDKFMTDDQFRDIVTDVVHENGLDDVNILILCDCCHSGTIGDLRQDDWDGIKAVSMSGCQDSQTSGDTGRGGIFTHSVLMAVAQLQQNGEEDHSIAQLYKEQLAKDDGVFDSEQVITVQWWKALGSTADMAWPLLPRSDYTAPWDN